MRITRLLRINLCLEHNHAVQWADLQVLLWVRRPDSLWKVMLQFSQAKGL
jgi:hypothetical protein